MRRGANAPLNEEFRKIFVRRTKINYHFSFIIPYQKINEK